jgi:DNA polymerase I
MNNTSLPLMIIDGHNMFLRGFMASPQMNPVGDTIGGISVFLKLLRIMTMKYNPSHIFITWDAGGGSYKRRQIYKEYKSGNKARTMNRTINEQNAGHVQTEDEIRQLLHLLEYLDKLPVKQFFIDNCEADDVIAYLSSLRRPDKPVVIVSGDRDFYQLMSDDVILYSPSKKRQITVDECMNEFGCHPKNAVIARAIIGDKSDSIPGIYGIGPGWIKKNLPILVEPKPYELHEVITYLTDNAGKGKKWASVMDGFDIIERNYKLMDLGAGFLDHTHLDTIDTILRSDEKYKIDRLGLVKLLSKDGLTLEVRMDELMSSMILLSHKSNNEIPHRKV